MAAGGDDARRSAAPALVDDPEPLCFTTPHFDGHRSVRVRASRLGEIDLDELTGLIQDARLPSSSRRRAEVWLAEQGR